MSTFDAENPIVGSLLRKLDVERKNVAGDLIKKVPGPPGLDFGIQNRLNKLKEGNEIINNGNNLSPPPPPSPFHSSQRYVSSPQPPLPPHSSFNLLSPPPFPPERRRKNNR